MSPETWAQHMDAEAQRLSAYVVGFVLPVLVPQNPIGGEIVPPEAHLGGSGTLVEVNGLKGVLTAAHVADGIEHHKTDVGLILTKYRARVPHQVLFKPKYCRHVSIPDLKASGKLQWSMMGPDIAFIVLPPEATASAVGAKSFYNLSKRNTEMLEPRDTSPEEALVISGFAAEWTKEEVAQEPFKRVVVFNGRAIGPLDITHRWSDNGFDYFHFEARRGEGYDGPADFSGYSGSGVWQIVTAESEKGFEVKERLLVGVAFRQSDLISRNGRESREISCHGSKSIYGDLINKIGSTGR